MQRWDQAWQNALYGPEGFYLQPPGPRAHFRTAAHAAPRVLAKALARLAGEHGVRRIVDVGAGRGELASALVAEGGELSVHAVDVVSAPPGLDPGITWWAGIEKIPDDVLAGALIIGWELLDTVPTPIVQVGPDGVLCHVLVDRDGREQLGPTAGEHEVAWCRRWWPDVVSSQGHAPEPGWRAEIGSAREELWRDLVRRSGSARSLLLAVDYHHHRSRRPLHGSLTGYRHGRQVPAVPDGSCDLTAHVALDAVAAAGQDAGARTLSMSTQRIALCELGVTGRLQPGEPLNAAVLQRISQEAELIEGSGLGSFGWLLQQT